MKFNCINIIIVITSIHLILNQYTEIENFNEITIEKGTSNYTYQYPGTNETEKQYPYFFFKFSPKAQIDLDIIDEENNKESINFRNPDKYLFIKVKNLNPQNYTFVITNNRDQQDSLIFIDNSNEINTSLDKYFMLVFLTNNFNESPRPLIFNFEPLEFDLVLFVKQQYSLLEFCIMEGDKCNYKDDTSKLSFKKGEKIKFRYSLESQKYSFGPIIMSAHVTKYDEKIGFINYIASRTVRDVYLYIDVEDYDYFAMYSQNNFEAILILSEQKKNEFIYDSNKANYFHYEDKYSSGLSFFNNENQQKYLIIHREYDLDYNSNTEYGFFYLVQDLYYLKYDETFSIENKTYILLIKKADINNKNKYILTSSNKNMAIITSQINMNYLTDFLILDNYEKDYPIYIEPSIIDSTYTYYAFQNYKEKDSKIDFLIKNNHLNYYFDIYRGVESIFLRDSSFNYEKNFNINYFFYGIEEEYYLYYKKFYGDINFYQYNKDLNEHSNISELITDEKDYNLINNKLVTISGYQLFTFLNSKDNLFDFYIQKVNDSEHIQLDSEVFQFNNLVKLFKCK